MGRWADGPLGRWTVIIDPVGRSGEHNMAADTALLDQVAHDGGAFLRLYRWDPPTLSVGRNQPIAFSGIPIVRRPTGGQAVWHEDEVTYAVAAPIELFGSLRRAYCEIHAKLAKAVRSFGVNPLLAPAAHPPIRPSAHSSCFSAPVGGEILVDGKKLVGSAQVRRGNAFLQHGSILLGGVQPGSTGGETTLAAVLGRTVGFDEVVHAVTAAWGVAPVAAE